VYICSVAHDASARTDFAMWLLELSLSSKERFVCMQTDLLKGNANLDVSVLQERLLRYVCKEITECTYRCVTIKWN
jgi:hypothetical protein